MTFTYDPIAAATDLSRVRRRISDTDEADAFFTDEEIGEIIADEGGRWRLAAASALELMAANDLMVLKVMTRGDLSTDAAKTADAMLKVADRLRALDAAATAADEGGAFEIAEMVFDDFSARERLYGQALRGAL